MKETEMARMTEETVAWEMEKVMLMAAATAEPICWVTEMEELV